MRNILIFTILLIQQLSAAAQQSDSISLDQCQQQAREHYPIIRQSELLRQAGDLRISNINKTWYPQIYLNAQASVQSDVTSLPISLPGIKIPELNKDSYKITLDLNQTLYDGSQSTFQKDLEKASLQADLQNVEVELNKIREKINQLFFTVILAQENERLIFNVRDELNSKLKKTEAAVKNEVMLQQNADVLRAELLKTDQQLIEIRASKESAIQVLSHYTGISYPATAAFRMPSSAGLPAAMANNRPEMKLFDLQMDKAEVSKKLTSSRILPRVSLYAQAGYGRPGMNMLDPDFNPWATGGIKVSWNIWNWNLSANERKIIDVQKNILQTQKEAFDMNVQAAMQKDYGEIRKYDDLIQKDKEIIALRDKISQTLSVQLDNGTVTATEYTTELNAAAAARLNMHLHRVQQYMAIYNYLYNSGN
jgi:outer membrane protein TolC